MAARPECARAYDGHLLTLTGTCLLGLHIGALFTSTVNFSQCAAVAVITAVKQSEYGSYAAFS